MSTENKLRPSHRWVARQLGMSKSGISLLRNGRRTPSIPTMEAVERAFGWKAVDQFKARHGYAVAFERKIRTAYKNRSKA